MAIQKVNLKEKFALFHDEWSPKTVGEIDSSYFVKLFKAGGQFIWHHHENEDELFLVVKGGLTIMLRDGGDISLDEGEMVIIPKGVEHKPVAEKGAEILLLERKSTVNTGNIHSERTKSSQWI